jgi:folate-binding protein YgfZ
MDTRRLRWGRFPAALCGGHFREPRFSWRAKSWRKFGHCCARRLRRSAAAESGTTRRLEAGIPWFGVDFDEKQIPHEAGLEESHISYTKGCYTGQEIVERVRSRGQVNRRRVGLRFDGAAAPEAGTKLLAGGAEVGNVTSAAYSFAAKSAIGMGYLRREHTTPGRLLQWSGGTAEVIELPLAKK